MAKDQLKAMAEELEKTLASVPPPPPPKKPAAAAGAPDPAKEKAAPPLPAHTPISKAPPPIEDVTPVVRAIVEYSLSRAAQTRSAAEIGESIGHGITAASKELNLSESSLVDALDAYLGEVVKSAKRIVPGR